MALCFSAFKIKLNEWYDEFGELHNLALDYRIKSVQSNMSMEKQMMMDTKEYMCIIKKMDIIIQLKFGCVALMKRL